jgi:excisionase family DNA binding protein
MSTTSQPPDFLTVEEAARVLRIGRTAAYALARSWRDTDGQQGIPVVEFGRLLRVPRRALEELAGGSITTTPTRTTEQAVAEETARAVDPSPPTPPHATSTRHRHTRSTSSDQPTLPFT